MVQIHDNLYILQRLFPVTKDEDGAQDESFCQYRSIQKTVTEILKNIPETDFSYAMEKVEDH